MPVDALTNKYLALGGCGLSSVPRSGARRSSRAVGSQAYRGRHHLLVGGDRCPRRAGRSADQVPGAGCDVEPARLPDGGPGHVARSRRPVQPLRQGRDLLEPGVRRPRRRRGPADEVGGERVGDRAASATRPPTAYVRGSRRHVQPVRQGFDLLAADPRARTTSWGRCRRNTRPWAPKRAGCATRSATRSPSQAAGAATSSTAT